jgi:hypothetical protein
MHPSSVVEGKPVNDLVLGLALCFKAHVVKPLDLQRPEKRFSHRVVASLTLTGSQQLPFRLIDPRMA